MPRAVQLSSATPQSPRKEPLRHAEKRPDPFSAPGFEGDGIAETWRGLMGDPSLRAQVVAPPSNVSVDDNQDGTVDVSWSLSPDDGAGPEQFLGYRIYRADSLDGPFAIAQLNDDDLGTVTGGPQTVDGNDGHVYLVRAIKRETTASGSYENASQGSYSDPQVPWLTLAARNYGSDVGYGDFTGTTDDLETGAAIDVENGSVTIGTPLDIFRSAAEVSPNVDFVDSIGGLTGGESYIVRLYFSDIASFDVATIDVTLEGTLVLDNYSLESDLDEDGAPYGGVAKTFVVTIVDDAQDDLDLVVDADDQALTNALISAIEIISL